MAPVPQDENVKVLLLGAGFGGLDCGKALTDPAIDVTLIDRQNHHLFQPLLYQVATASLTAPDIAAPIREILSGRENVQVFMEEVTSIDLERQEVHTQQRSHEYDYLVIGLGVCTGYFGNAEWEAHAPGLKSLEDARHLRHRVLQAVERAELCEDADERRRLLSIVMVGGGPTGVELAGAFTELIHRTLRDGFKNVSPKDLRVILVEGSPRLLGMFDESQSIYAEERLNNLGIEVRTGTIVSNVREGEVTLGEEVLEAATIIWAAGTEANPVTAGLDVEKDRVGRLIVEPDCSLPSHPNVFAIGDIAHCRDKNGILVPPLAAAAAQMGKHVARVIQGEVRLKQGPHRQRLALLRPQFSYFDKGIMAIIGKSAAVVKMGRIRMRGFLAWLAWLFIHLLLLVGFRNKLAVLLQWAFAYLKGKRSARIIVAPDSTSEARLK